MRKKESSIEGGGQTSGLHHFGSKFWSKTWQTKIWEKEGFSWQNIYQMSFEFKFEVEVDFENDVLCRH